MERPWFLRVRISPRNSSSRMAGFAISLSLTRFTKDPIPRNWRILRISLSAYSRSTYDEQTFWSIYDRRSYDALKRAYDPTGRFPGLYEKAVGCG
jgi:hypothetical protein